MMSRPPVIAELDLSHPVSLGVYDRYLEAQQAVDHLADEGFPVQNVEIVGTELRSRERVTGRLTRGRIATAGVFSGLWIGLFVGIAFSLFSNQNQLGFLFTTPLLGAVFGLLWSQIGYSATTQLGRRDFASVSQIVATKYELLVENEHAVRAQHLLSNMAHDAAL